MKFLMYGAGSIGRGFIGSLFAQAGYEVVFVDVNRNIINTLNECHSYRCTVTSDPPYDISVQNVRGVDGQDEAAVIEEIASCDLMATSLGANVLPHVAPVIAKGFQLRMKRSKKPLNLLICENLKDAAHILRGWLSDALPEADRLMLDTHCGLIEAAIGRMVPVAPPNDSDPLHITVEEYGFLPIDKAAFIGTPPDIKCLVPYSPFAFYEERKLYLHNMGHAVCAYLGLLRGCETIPEAVSDPYVRLFTQNAMTESAAMLSGKYDVPFASVYDHAEDLLLRFSNTILSDTCERVGRDPMRKLQSGDRFAGTLCRCFEHGVYPVYIALGYAAALYNHTGNAGQAEHIVLTHGRLPEEQAKLVMRMFALIELPAPELLRAAEKVKKELRGDIV